MAAVCTKVYKSPAHSFPPPSDRGTKKSPVAQALWLSAADSTRKRGTRERGCGFESESSRSSKIRPGILVADQPVFRMREMAWSVSFLFFFFFFSLLLLLLLLFLFNCLVGSISVLLEEMQPLLYYIIMRYSNINRCSYVILKKKQRLKYKN